MPPFVKTWGVSFSYSHQTQYIYCSNQAGQLSNLHSLEHNKVLSSLTQHGVNQNQTINKSGQTGGRMALAKKKSPSPPQIHHLYIHFLPSSCNHHRHHRLSTADGNSYLLTRKKNERKRDRRKANKTTSNTHIYTITKHIKYILGHNICNYAISFSCT